MNGGVRGRIEGGRGRDEFGEGWVTGGGVVLRAGRGREEFGEGWGTRVVLRSGRGREELGEG